MRAARTISVGNVAAGRICAISGSGYRAIGPMRSSSWAADSVASGCDAPAGAAGAWAPEGVVDWANANAADRKNTAQDPENGRRVFMMYLYLPSWCRHAGIVLQ